MRFNRWARGLRSSVARVRRRPAVSASASAGDRDRDPDDHGGPGGDPPDRSGGFSLYRFLPRRFLGLGRPVRIRFRIRRHAGQGLIFRPRFPRVVRDSAGNGSKAHGEEADGAKDRDDGFYRRPEMGSAHVKPPLETSNHFGKRYVDAGYACPAGSPRLAAVTTRDPPRPRIAAGAVVPDVGEDRLRGRSFHGRGAERGEMAHRERGCAVADRA